jgi:hypothetical protein
MGGLGYGEYRTRSARTPRRLGIGHPTQLNQCHFIGCDIAITCPRAACLSSNHGYSTSMGLTQWMLLSSRLPREPSRLRLAIWRRLRRLGAVLLHDAIWVLPADAKTREAFEWLAEEIRELGGTAWAWEATGISAEQDRDLVALFRQEADSRYAQIGQSAVAIRDALLRGRRRGRRARLPASSYVGHAIRQLRGLERAVRLEQRRDYFRAPGRDRASSLIATALTELDALLPASGEDGRTSALGH